MAANHKAGVSDECLYYIANIPCVLSHVAYDAPPLNKPQIHVFDVSFDIPKEPPEFLSLKKWVDSYYSEVSAIEKPDACACVLMNDDIIIKCLRVPVKQ